MSNLCPKPQTLNQSAYQAKTLLNEIPSVAHPRIATMIQNDSQDDLETFMEWMFQVWRASLLWCLPLVHRENIVVSNPHHLHHLPHSPLTLTLAKVPLLVLELGVDRKIKFKIFIRLFFENKNGLFSQYDHSTVLKKSLYDNTDIKSEMVVGDLGD